MVKLKRGVNLSALKPEMWFAAGYVDAVCRMLVRVQATVTSATEGSHASGSLHPAGLAVDFRTRDMREDERLAVYHYLRASLDRLGYDTVLETDHIHVEYQPRAGETWLVATD